MSLFRISLNPVFSLVDTTDVVGIPDLVGLNIPVCREAGSIRLLLLLFRLGLRASWRRGFWTLRRVSSVLPLTPFFAEFQLWDAEEALSDFSLSWRREHTARWRVASKSKKEPQSFSMVCLSTLVAMCISSFLRRGWEPLSDVGQVAVGRYYSASKHAKQIGLAVEG